MANETLGEVELAHRYADLGDVRLHYVEAGEGPLVLLLHGFPQFWYEWRHQIPALLEAGFRVVAPDMRGYNLSDKPPGVRAYRVELLACDVERLILALRRTDGRRGRARLGRHSCLDHGDAPPRARREARDPQRSPPGSLP